ncbi:unnamed protein product [Kluyveromyces dobzhanskii CBS 2104]|uniref:RING-type E3 ubiquitin transferase n=2 Tax=Kluyveromyces dobzhanskii TaxID=51656 RepID=A0A0A8LCD7_9SACH|nr:unnamed protein product [Kluyveromyces dobzhanskii CBS 2104]
MERHFAQRRLDAQLDAQLGRRDHVEEEGEEGGINPQPAVILDNQDGQPTAILNLNLDYKYLPSYISIVFSVIGGYLFVSYALATVIGYLLNFIYFRLITIMLNGIKILATFLRIPYYNQKVTKMWYAAFVIENWIYQSILTPIISNYYDYLHGTAKHTMLVRMIAPVSTYTTFIVLCCSIPEILSRGHSKKFPLKSSIKRTIFKFSYIIKCTLKVLGLFTLELAGFPILAGFLIDVSLISPMLLPQNHLTFVPHFCSFWPPMAFITYWAIGTVYMYHFAQYVGMVRQYIIRPGVLFFIRSPDDPNIKLLQDSLIYPMKLQLSRLALSMAIYTAFILVGFGFHTRLLFPYILRSELLPMKHGLSTLLKANSMFSIAVIAGTYIILSKNRVIDTYVRQYWVFVFNICSRKIRLSSFILGKDAPTERGRVVYRNFYHKWFNSNKARLSNMTLYSHPKSLDETAALFRNTPDVHAYFVPDGTMMRVPASDIISKKYAQLLFVSVTKDDKLLKPLDIQKIKERQRRNAGEFGYLEKQPTEFDEYKVVYVPPHFTTTYSLLIVFIWIFASLLFTVILLISNFAGLPLILVLQLLLNSLIPAVMDCKVELYHSVKPLNLLAVCSGMVLLSVALSSYHAHVLENIHLNERIIEVDVNNVGDVLDAAGNVGNEQNENVEMNGQEVEEIIEDDIWPTLKVFISTIYPVFIFYVMPFIFKLNVNYHYVFLFTYLKSFYWDGIVLENMNSDVSFIPSISALASRTPQFGISAYSLILGAITWQLATVIYVTVQCALKKDKTLGSRKLIMKSVDASFLFLVAMIALPLSLQYILSVIEYLLHKQSYTSAWAPFIYFMLVQPFNSADHHLMSVCQKMFYHIDFLTFCFAFILVNSILAKMMYESLSQSVRDEVYARGTIVKNFEE